MLEFDELHFSLSAGLLIMMVMIITSTIITTITDIMIPDPEQAELFELEELHCSLSRRSVTTGESYSANDDHHHVHDVDVFCDHVNDMEIDIK